MPTSVYKPDLLDEALARIRRESIEDAEACDRAGPPTYSILERAGGDPDEEARLAAHHVQNFRCAYRAYRLEMVALVDLIRELDAAKAEAQLQQERARQKFLRDTQHDRLVLGPWLQESEALQGRKRSIEILGCTLGLRKFNRSARVEATAEFLASLFPDLTVARLTSMAEAKKRLRIEGRKVVVAETGEVIHDADAPIDGQVPQVWIKPAESGEVRFVKLGDEELLLELGDEAPADDAAPEGAEEASDNGE
jgi:hypothetical protein